MKLNKEAQYALLLAFYLVRSGRTTIESVSDSLGLSYTFLQRIANKMRKYGVLTSTKGPNGGYELNGEPTVRDVLLSLGNINPLGASDLYRLTSSKYAEEKALGHVAVLMGQANDFFMRRKIRAVSQESVGFGKPNPAILSNVRMN
jgi:DNA-binding IscR family transcriptional regulator